MREAVIVDGVRTPFGKRGGMLKDIHPVVLGSLVLRELIARSGLDADRVEDVIWGCVGQAGEQSLNIGRNTWLAAGFPDTTPATTVDRQCGSGQQAIHFAASMIQSGNADIVIAGGAESMSRIPIGSQIGDGLGSPFPPELMERYDLVPQGISAELVARKYGVTRTAKGYLRSQIVPVELPPDGEGRVRVMDRDEGIRTDSSYERVAALRPAFDPEHSITAANSSQITDGAAALMLMSAERAWELGLKPRARILAQKVVGCDPVLMLEGPIPGTAAVLEQAAMSLEDIDLFEINEAFASVVLAWQKATGADMARTNVNGGAIAIGHPLGASGARLMCHLLYELERRDRRYGLQAMCCGGGLGTATIIDRVVL
jgi:acetyl-CoA acyltransferase